MRKILILFAIVVTLVFSCNVFAIEEIKPHEVKERVAYQRVIPESSIPAATQFITATVKAANPMSDEEPEDNIKAVYKVAEEIFGVPVLGMVIYDKSFSYGAFVPYDKLAPEQRAVCDDYLNIKRKTKGN